MNWKLIFALSIFGLLMGIATVYFIPSTVEPLFWLVIFVVCAYLIAKNVKSKYFITGLMVSLVNSVWITSSHLIFYDNYIARHAQEAQMMLNSPFADNPKLMMLITGPVIGLLSGLVLGLFAFIASKFVKSN